MYKYILLDWDGSLANTLDLWLEVFKVVLAEYNIQMDDKRIVSELFGDWKAAQKLGIADENKIINRILGLVNEKYPFVKLYDGVYETLSTLKNQGKKMALITNSRMATIQQALVNNKLEKMFEELITVDKVSKHKPDPESLFKALDLLGGKQEEAIMVGDSDKDLGAAKNAKVDSVLFFPEENNKFYELEELKKLEPKHIITEFNQLLKIINE